MNRIKFFVLLIGCMAITLCPMLASADNPVPAVIPKYDGEPGAKDKPVQIYIFSGQSNSFGFGRAEGGDLHYSSIVLSADPRVKTTKMPVGTAGLLPHYVFTTESGDEKGATAKVYEGAYEPGTDYSKLTPVSTSTIALGDATLDLPGTDGPHTTVVEGFIEIPMTGMHEINPGYKDSEFAVAKVNGEEVYSKLTDAPATKNKIKLEAGKRYPISIVYTKGGKASFWMELVNLKPRGSLKYMIEEHGQFPNLVDENGEWIVRKDAHVNNTYTGKGKDAPFSPMWRNGTFGPEVGFGNVIATYHDAPVILMKTDIGNRSLGWDILPPGSERFQVGDTMYAGYGDGQSNWPVAQGEPKKGGWYAGKQYDEYTQSIHHVIKNFAKFYPQYADQGYEIAGFVWWQGHKDQNPVHASRYAENFANLVKAWRKEFNAPDAPFVLATIAFEGWDLKGDGKAVAEAQLSVDGDSGKFPEHKGNVKTIEARDFWREPGESPKNQGYHYNHNGETYFLVGDALGRAMVELKGGEVEPRVHREVPKTPEAWPDEPTLEEAAQMLFTNAFISPWAKDPAEPTKEELQAMIPALEPYIIGELIPSYIRNQIYIPAYRRKGVWAVPIITGEPEKGSKNSAELRSSGLDEIIAFYNAVGIDDYDWKPFGPEMRLAEWDYYSFTPTEPVTNKLKSQYRKVKMPEGMENWYAVDFDAEKAGWKKGQAPFGNKNGKKLPLRNNAHAQCRSDEMPNTFWENDALFIRQTFDVPELKEGHRYRLVVGGGNYPWAGDGFAVYINGKLFAEEENAKFKEGGVSGRYFFNDFLPELESGKITVAVKAFLRRSGNKGKSAPPQGHLSIWLEEAKMPELLLEEVEKREAAKKKKK